MENKFYFAKGIIRYKEDGWVIIECPFSVVNYYKWWVEKMVGKKISTSYHKPHITVVAAKHEPAKIMANWKKREGQVVDFRYFSDIRCDADWPVLSHYFWLLVDCPAVKDIRVELGLKPNLKFAPHLTIGYLN